MHSLDENISVNIGEAIKRLRQKLGETQEGMSRRLNCTLSGFRKWESGVAFPGGAYVIKMMQLCPDKESIEAFGVLIPQDESTRSRVKIQGEAEVEKTPSETATEVRKMLRQLRRQAQAGDRYAKEAVEIVEEELIRGAGIVTNHDIPKGRRKEELKAGIKRLAEEKIKSNLGT